MYTFIFANVNAAVCGEVEWTADSMVPCRTGHKTGLQRLTDRVQPICRAYYEDGRGELWRGGDCWFGGRRITNLRYADDATLLASRGLHKKESGNFQRFGTRKCTLQRRRDHITPILRDLHWLPVRCRVDYKLALLVYKSLHVRLGAILPCWRLHLGFLWQVSPPSAFSRRWHIHRPEDPYPFWRPEFLRCRSGSPDLEQLAARTATTRHWAWRIPSITEDIFVCVGTAEMAGH